MNLQDLIFKTCNVLEDRIIVIVHIPSTSHKVLHITLAAICAILTFTGICLNVCTIITIWKTPILREKLSNFVIMMQSTSDVLNATLVMPLFTHLNLSEITGTANCLEFYVCKKLASLIFLFSLTTFSVLNHERYMGICHPIFHRTRVKKRYLLNYVISMSTLQSLAVGSTFYHSQTTRSVIGFCCILFLAHTIFVYTKIARAIQIKVRINQNQQGTNTRSKSMQYLREIKAAKSCFFIVICSIMCNLPSIVIVSEFISIESVSTVVNLTRWFMALVMLNSSLNSVILFWRDKKLRIYSKNLLKCSWN